MTKRQNDAVHRAAVNDVYFKIRAARGFGATVCYFVLDDYPILRV
jgi:hypothetical protein